MTCRKVWQKFPFYQALALAIIHVLVGGAFLCAGIAQVQIHAYSFFHGTGIVFGVLFIIVGAFGIASVVYKRSCYIYTFMILSLSATLFCIANAGICFLGMLRHNTLGLPIVLLILSFVEIVACIWSAMISGGTVCCGGHLTDEVGERWPRQWPKFHSKQAILLGVMQAVLGILCVVFEAAAIKVGAMLLLRRLDVFGGLYGGFTFIVTGVFGVGAAVYKTSCHIYSFMILSIVAVAIFNPIIIFTSAFELHNDDKLWQCTQNFTKKYYRGIDIDCQTEKMNMLAMTGMLLVVCVVEEVVGIWSVVLCCANVCCGQQNSGRYKPQVEENDNNILPYIPNENQQEVTLDGK